MMSDSLQTSIWMNSYPEAMLDYLSEKIDKSRAEKASGALLSLSIDSMPLILHSLSIERTNNVLERIEEAIRLVIGESGACFMAGQDYFCVVLHPCNEEQCETVALKINHSLHQLGTKYPELSVHISSSIGSSFFNENTQSVDEVIKQAWTAMDRIKHNSGVAYREYDQISSYFGNSRDKMVLAGHLQSAIQRNALRLAYQPIITSKTGKVMCYECLLRIIEEDGSIKSAGPYIPIAEELGFMEEIDTIVLYKVYEELQRNDNIVLAFNISNQTVDSRQWMIHTEKLLRDPSIANRMIVEITETGFQRDLRNVISFTAALQSLGCKVALDDFGSGYTSFKQLKLLPVNIIKIDGSFIKNMSSNLDNRLFVESLLNFTNSFNLETVAEFVENGEIAKTLMELNVDYLQGYYFSPAVNYRPWVCEK